MHSHKKKLTEFKGGECGGQIIGTPRLSHVLENNCSANFTFQMKS
jgi:hypothetical protein